MFSEIVLVLYEKLKFDNFFQTVSIIENYGLLLLLTFLLFLVGSSFFRFVRAVYQNTGRSWASFNRLVVASFLLLLFAKWLVPGISSLNEKILRVLVDEVSLPEVQSQLLVAIDSYIQLKRKTFSLDGSVTNEDVAQREQLGVAIDRLLEHR